MHQTHESKTERNFLIDVLRGISIVIVMMLHGAIQFPGLLAPFKFASNIVINGAFGVDIFFVISGYLIANNTLKRYGKLTNISIGPFFVMRIARIAPCLTLFSIFYAALAYSGQKDFVPADINMVLTGIQSIYTLHFNYFYFTIGNVPGMYPMAPLWSIAVEETFYLLFPIVCFLCLKDRIVIIAAVLLIVLGPALRNTFTDTLTLSGVVDLLAMGCLTAQIVHLFHVRIPPYAATIAVVVSAVLLFVTMSLLSARTDYRWALTFIGTFTSAYIFACRFVRCSFPITLMLWPLAFLGRMSLQLYVFHDAIHYLGQAAGMPTNATFAVTIVTSWILEWSFLEPCNRSIRRLYAEISRPDSLTLQSRTSLIASV